MHCLGIFHPVLEARDKSVLKIMKSMRFWIMVPGGLWNVALDGKTILNSLKKTAE